MGEEMEDRVRELEVNFGRLAVQLDHVSAELARLNAGINRLIWVIATGFVVGAVQWVIKGGLGG